MKFYSNGPTVFLWILIKMVRSSAVIVWHGASTEPEDWYKWHCRTPVFILPPSLPFSPLPSTFCNSLCVVAPHLPSCWLRCLQGCCSIITEDCTWSCEDIRRLGKAQCADLPSLPLLSPCLPACAASLLLTTLAVVRCAFCFWVCLNSCNSSFSNNVSYV